MNITNLKSRIQKLSDHGLASLAKVKVAQIENNRGDYDCLLYTSPSPRDQRGSRMPSSA